MDEQSQAIHLVSRLTVMQQDGAIALKDPSSGRTLLTNKVGLRIFELMDGVRSEDLIVNALSEAYPTVDRLELARQTSAFIADCKKKGLLRVGGPLPSPPRPVTNHLPIFVERGQHESQDTAEREERESLRKFHPDVYWYLTFRCNLACTHCSVLSSPWVDTSQDLKTAECLGVVDQLAEMNVSTAMLTGGEALIRPDAVRILQALGERNIGIGLETNGLRFDPDFIEVAVDLQARGLLNVAISLDGGTEETNAILRGARSFERTVRGMRLLREHGISFDVQCVLNAKNYHTIPDLYDLMAEMQPVRMQWSPLNMSGRGNELIRQIGLRYEQICESLDLIAANKHKISGLNLIKFPPALVPPHSLMSVYKGQDVGCSTSCKFPLLGILPNGDITVCAVSRNDDSLYFGNVRTARLKDAWEKARMDLLRQRYVGADELKGICSDCVWKATCKGSCRAMAYEDGGDFFSPFPACQDANERGLFPDVYKISKRGEALMGVAS